MGDLETLRDAGPYDLYPLPPGGHYQPREGVRGKELTGDMADLLRLDTDAVSARNALAAMARHLDVACRVGHPAPIVRDMADRIRNPRPGDLVIESTRGWSPRADPDTRLKALGILLLSRTEWGTTDEEWRQYLQDWPGADMHEHRGTTDVTYVQYGPAVVDVCRWANCSFISVPVQVDWFR